MKDYLLTKAKEQQNNYSRMSISPFFILNFFDNFFIRLIEEGFYLITILDTIKKMASLSFYSTNNDPLSIVLVGDYETRSTIKENIERVRGKLEFEIQLEENCTFTTAKNMILKQHFDLVLSTYQLYHSRTVKDLLHIIEEQTPKTQLAIYGDKEGFKAGAHLIQYGAIDSLNLEDPNFDSLLLKTLINAHFNSLVLKRTIIEVLIVGTKTIERSFRELISPSSAPVNISVTLDPIGALEQIERYHLDLVVVEESTGEGLDICESIRNHNQSLTILFWGKEGHTEVTLEALRRGANYFYWPNDSDNQIEDVLNEVYKRTLKEAIKRSVKGATILDLFIFHKDGPPLADFPFVGLGKDMDDILVSGFLTAITSFVKDILDGEIGYLSAEKYGVAIRSEGDIIVAVFFRKNDNIPLIQLFIEEVFDKIKRLLRERMLIKNELILEVTSLSNYHEELSNELVSFVQQIASNSQISVTLLSPEEVSWSDEAIPPPPLDKEE